MTLSISTPRCQSLGPWLCQLEDYELIELFEWFSEEQLNVLSLVSRYFYLISHQEELWKTLCLRKTVLNKIAHFKWKGTWRRSCLLYTRSTIPPFPYQRLEWKDIRAPRLTDKWRRSKIDLNQFDLKEQTIDKRHNLSLEEFIEQYEKPNKPVILCGMIDGWKSRTTWKKDAFLKKYGEVIFKTNGTTEDGKTFRMKTKDYWEYMESNSDDKPLYLFDNKFLERAPQMGSEYQVLPHFYEDLFELMEKEDRPDWQWFIAGPARSGSPFHQDPHRTSAWNALLHGRKRWTLYPPDVIPPGVDEKLIDTEFYASPDVMKYFDQVYPRLSHYKKKPSPLEGILEEGEVIFVPSGWWHQVLNLTDTIAVTQNFCSPRNFELVFQDLMAKKSVSLKKDFIDAIYPKKPYLFQSFEPIEQCYRNPPSSPSSSSFTDSSSSSFDSSSNEEEEMDLS